MKDRVTEPDFGIWDSEYACLVHNTKGRINEIRLSSRKEDIEKARTWQTYILKKAYQIKKLADLNRFLHAHLAL